ENNIISRFILSAINGRKKHGEHIHFKVGEIDAIQNIMHVIISEIYSNNHLKEIRVNFLVGLLMTELLSNVQASDYHINGSYNESLAMAVLRYIDTDYKTASLKEISCRLNQPNYKVSKLIKDFTGKNFSDLLVEKRLDVLIHLLKHTNHSIIDVINMTGYENASHCYKVFKEKYNMSIKEYRDLNS
ncbi:helix-turn-helix domain-containing protein, partial [Klebsiella pneumoniae]